MKNRTVTLIKTTKETLFISLNYNDDSTDDNLADTAWEEFNGKAKNRIKRETTYETLVQSGD